MLPNDRFDVKQTDDVLLVRIVDSYTVRANRDPWIEIVKFARNTRPPKVLIDLSGVLWISSSSGINTLVLLWKEIRDYNGQLVICSLPPVAAEEFQICHLDRMFQIADDEEAGLQMLR